MKIATFVGTLLVAINANAIDFPHHTRWKIAESKTKVSTKTPKQARSNPGKSKAVIFFLGAIAFVFGYFGVYEVIVEERFSKQEDDVLSADMENQT